MNIIFFLFKAVVIIYLIIFSVANTEKATINLFFNDAVLELPMFLLAIGLLVFGCIIGLLSQASDKWKLRREIRRLKTSINQSTADYSKLKNMAISDDIPSKKIDSNVENSLVKKQIR